MKKTLLLLVFMTGCGHWGNHTVKYDIPADARTLLLSGQETTACSANSEFSLNELLERARYLIVHQAMADGVLNCNWSVRPDNNDESCVIMRCRPFLLYQPGVGGKVSNPEDDTVPQLTLPKNP